MELYHRKFELESLTVNKGDIERLMGYAPGESPDPFPEMIEEVYRELEGHCDPQGGYVILDGPEFDLQANTTRINAHTFFTDKIVTRMLRKSRSVAFFVCTAGGGIETWTKEASSAGDPVKGFVIDAFGSEVAEAIANELHSGLETGIADTGMKITNRYSPGYCGWPVRDQQKLFSFFPEEFCGISLSESSLMHPIKSVSGMIGIGPDVRFQRYTCDNCNDKNCIYRRLRK